MNWLTQTWCDFEPGALTARLERIGEDTGEFEASQAMVLTGRVMVVLSYRHQPSQLTSSDLHGLVTQVLTRAGHHQSARHYVEVTSAEAFHPDDSASTFAASATATRQGDHTNPLRDVPKVIKGNGRVEELDAGELLTLLTELGRKSGEYGEEQAMVVAGEVIDHIMRLQPPVLTEAALYSLVENVLILNEYTVTARQWHGLPTLTVQPVEESLRSFFSTIEAVLCSISSCV